MTTGYKGGSSARPCRHRSTHRSGRWEERAQGEDTEERADRGCDMEFEKQVVDADGAATEGWRGEESQVPGGRTESESEQSQVAPPANGKGQVRRTLTSGWCAGGLLGLVASGRRVRRSTQDSESRAAVHPAPTQVRTTAFRHLGTCTSRGPDVGLSSSRFPASPFPNPKMELNPLQRLGQTLGLPPSLVRRQRHPRRPGFRCRPGASLLGRIWPSLGPVVLALLPGLDPEKLLGAALRRCGRHACLLALLDISESLRHDHLSLFGHLDH